MNIDEPYVLLFALYLRDAMGLGSQGFPPIPPLSPAIPLLIASIPEKEKIALQWSDWWQKLLSEYFRNPKELDRNKGYFSPEFAALEPIPELRHCAQLCFREAANWINARRHEQILELQLNKHPSVAQDVVREIIDESSGKENVFHLCIITLPIQGKHAWMIAKDQAIVGRELMRDPVACRVWLSPVIAALL